MNKSVYVFYLLILTLFSSCKGTKSETHSSSPVWRALTLNVEGANGSLGGMDMILDKSGHSHVALIMKVSDKVLMTSFQLIYFTNSSGAWKSKILKSSVSPFYLVRGGNNENNFLRVHMDAFDEPFILFTSVDFELIKMNLTGEEEVLVTQVGSFSSSYDSQGNFYIAAEDSAYETMRLHYYKFSDFHLLDHKTFQDNSFEHVNPLHFEILFEGDEPVILTKAQKLVIIHKDQISLIPIGDREGSVFNAYWKNGKIKTCAQNADFERFEFLLDLSIMELTRSKVKFQLNNESPYHCMVTENPERPFLRYNNYAPYNNKVEVSSGRTFILPLLELKLFKLMNGKIVAGGLDEKSGRPVVYLEN